MPDELLPTVQAALTAVMADVREVRKNQRNTQQNYNFRGIDAVINAVGPSLREHGIVILPTADEITQEAYQTKSGTMMLRTTVKMLYKVVGPDGTMLMGSAYGEAADAGDKGVAKAQSVAYRVFLLQALTIPTDDADPDEESHERVQAEEPKPPTAQERGFKSKVEVKKTWDGLLEATMALPEESVAELREWAKKEGIYETTITADQASAWTARLAAIVGQNGHTEPDQEPVGDEPY